MAAPVCGHPVNRQLKGVPTEYAGLCGCCLINYAVASGILFSRGWDSAADIDKEAGQ